MERIKVEIVADSVNSFGDRLTSLVLTYPRIIHSEMMTHRMFSRNASSSRAVPVDKMIKAVKENTFCPLEFQKLHKGMQGSEYFTGVERQECINLWLESAELTLQQAEKMKAKGISKQIINRILEPYQYYTVLLTATEFENFFSLRCPQYNFPDVNQENIFKSRKEVIQHFKDTMYFEKYWKEEALEIEWLQRNKSQAEIHMQALAEAMWDAYNESIPKTLQSGEWHIPFGDNIDEDKIEDLLHGPHRASYIRKEGDIQQAKIEISTARCARLSYMTFDGEIDYKKDLKLHDTLLDAGHFSPFEHCARAMSEEEYYTFIKGKSNANWDTDLVTDNTYEISAQFDHNVLGWCNNFKGFIQYRYLIENNYEQ